MSQIEPNLQEERPYRPKKARQRSLLVTWALMGAGATVGVVLAVVAVAALVRLFTWIA